MRLDRANRNFAILAGSSLLLGMYWICGGMAGVLAPLIVSRASHGGVESVVSGSHSLVLAVTFVAFVCVGVSLGIHSLLQQIRGSRALAERVSSIAAPLPATLVEAAARADLQGRVILVDALEWFSFVYGSLSPRVVISRGLFEGISGDELAAVLEHEGYHVRNLDPLKVLIGRALLATFLFLPALSALRARYVAARELAADRQALQACGRVPLAAALFKVVRGPAWKELEVATALGGAELLEIRVTQLENGCEPPLVGLSATGTVLSLLVVVAFAAAFVSSVVSFGGRSAVAHVTGATIDVTEILCGVLCAVPLASGALAVYWWIARRAREPLHR
jgi:beta-lactamase regulating signal transducer with metallopeptidase domain